MDDPRPGPSGPRRQARDLAAAALSSAAGHADGATHALLHVTHARALAALGERQAAARALLAAEDAIARDGRPQADYSLLAGPAAGTFASHTARALTEVGGPAPGRVHYRGPRRVPPGSPVHLLTWTDLGDTLAAQAHGDCYRAAARAGLAHAARRRRHRPRRGRRMGTPAAVRAQVEVRPRSIGTFPRERRTKASPSPPPPPAN